MCEAARVLGDRLAIYLNDHLAAATAASELAGRIAGQNEGTEVGELTGSLHEQLQDDREALTELLDRSGSGRDRAKVLAGWTAEKLGRLKLNGQILGYSPLSRLEELEGLSVSLEYLALAWASLADAAIKDAGKPGFTERASRAAAARAALEGFRAEAAREALAEPAVP
jgi:hypothetical protein